MKPLVQLDDGYSFEDIHEVVLFVLHSDGLSDLVAASATVKREPVNQDPVSEPVQAMSDLPRSSL